MSRGIVLNIWHLQLEEFSDRSELLVARLFTSHVLIFHFL